MNKKFRCKGIITQRPKGGMLRCKECGQILGYLNEDMLSYAYLQLVCRCGADGYLELGTGKSQPPDAMADIVDDHLSCPECFREWMSVSDSVTGYALRVECCCGILADNRHKRRRNVYEELKNSIF